jgi:hypothetical protein
VAAEAWFRHTHWTDQIEREFFARLAKARKQGDQYLVIQASTLAEKQPDVALRLINIYFESKTSDFHDVRALDARVRANLALGRESDAVATMKEILARERMRPSIKTNTFTEFPYYVATHRVTSEYDRALDTLINRKADLAFPLNQFQWHAAMSIICAERGDHGAAKTHAKFAIDAASVRDSGFRYHSDLGLVDDRFDAVMAELRQIAH